MRVFVDANVLFSAALGGRGRPQRLFDFARAGGVSLVATEYVIDEARRNLTKKAPPAVQHLNDLVLLIEVAAKPSGEMIELARGSGLPEKDAPVLAAAITAGVDLLVTGDRRHFGAMFGRAIRGVRLLSLKDGLDVVRRTVG